MSAISHARDFNLSVKRQVPQPVTQTNAESLKQVAQTLALPEDVKEFDDGKEFADAAEKMRWKLKFHYIRSRSDIEAKELLYGRVASSK